MVPSGNPLASSCTVIDSLQLGGAERLVTTVHKYLAAEMNLYPPLVTLYPGGKLEGEARGAGVRVVSLGDYRQISAARWMARFRQFLLQERPEVIQGHLFPVSYLLAGGTLGLPISPSIVFTEHSVSNRRRASQLMRPIEWLAYTRFRRVLCVSESVRKSLVDWLPSVEAKTAVLRNCVDVPAFAHGGGAAKLWDIVAVGNLRPEKGFEFLLEAVAMLRHRRPQVRVAIAGGGPLEQELRDRISRLGLQGMVHLLGPLESIPELLASSRVFVLPSRVEGLPIAALEAMAAGLPVVASRVGGLAEIVEPEVTGFLVEPGSADELARAMEVLLGRPELAQRLGRAGRCVVEREAGVERYVGRLAEILEESRRTLHAG